MAYVEVQSCPICLDTDEKESMVLVPVPHLQVGPVNGVIICRRCADAIAKAWLKLVESETPAPVGEGK